MPTATQTSVHRHPAQTESGHENELQVELAACVLRCRNLEVISDDQLARLAALSDSLVDGELGISQKNRVVESIIREFISTGHLEIYDLKHLVKIKCPVERLGQALDVAEKFNAAVD